MVFKRCISSSPHHYLKVPKQLLLESLLILQSKMGDHIFSVLLSHNVGVRADSHGVEVNKITTSSNSTIQLSFEEWFSIYGMLGDLNKRVKSFADGIFDYVLKGTAATELDFENYERIVSDKVAVAVSVFKPKTRHFISISIRSYFYNPAGKMIFKKYPGITLNQDEFNSLKCQANQINQFICDLASSHNWHQDSPSGYSRCRLCTSVEQFYQSDRDEPAPMNLKTEFKLECKNPAEFIPAYRRIHEFAASAPQGSVLTITINKHYHLDSFSVDDTVPETINQSQKRQLEPEDGEIVQEQSARK